MNRTGWFLFGVTAGALGGLMLAPQTGRRTRAMVKDKAVKYTHEVSQFAQKKSHHVANRAHGYAHDLRRLVGRAQSVTPQEEMLEGTSS